MGEEAKTGRFTGPTGLCLDGSNKGVYTRNMEAEEVDFVACRQCVCTAARRRSRDLTRVFEKAMRGSGVRGTQFTLLATLVQTGPIADHAPRGLPGPRADDADAQPGSARSAMGLFGSTKARTDAFVRSRSRRPAKRPRGAPYPFWKKAQDARLWRRQVRGDRLKNVDI